MGRKPGAPMKLLLIGGVVGVVIGVVLTVFYFSLGIFFAVQANQNVAEHGNENAEDKKPGRVGQGNPGLGREVPSPAKDTLRRRIRA